MERLKWTDKIKKMQLFQKSESWKNNGGTDKGEVKKLFGTLAKNELPAEERSRTGVFNPRPAGEFCAAREGYFTKYNAL